VPYILHNHISVSQVGNASVIDELGVCWYEIEMIQLQQSVNFIIGTTTWDFDRTVQAMVIKKAEVTGVEVQPGTTRLQRICKCAQIRNICRALHRSRLADEPPQFWERSGDRLADPSNKRALGYIACHALEIHGLSINTQHDFVRLPHVYQVSGDDYCTQWELNVPIQEPRHPCPASIVPPFER
jgi:hypothetical protein